MPYITPFEREKFDSHLCDFPFIASPGQLNYVISRLMLEYVKNMGESYATYNALIGVCEAAKLELYRKLVAPYEDEKEKKNGKL